MSLFFFASVVVQSPQFRRLNHVFRDDREICYEAVSLPQGPRVFCYRTLGGIDCYRELNPRDGNEFKVEPQPPSGGLPPFGMGS